MNETDLKNQIRQLVAEDNLDIALQMLIDHTIDHEKLDGIIIQLARLNQIKKVEANGTITHSEINNELNKVRSNLLSYIRTESLLLKVPLHGIERSLEEFEERLALSVTRVKVAEVFLSNLQKEKGLTITEILQLSNLKSRKLVVDFINELTLAGLVIKIKEAGKTLWMMNEKGGRLLKKRIKME